MKNISDDQRELLRAPLPAAAISQHPTKTFLHTIKAIYVIERMNDVFGLGEWKVINEFVERVEKMVVVKSSLTINGYDVYIEAFGGNDNPDLGDAYKGACTDALTKICSHLEIGMDVFKGFGTTAAPKSKNVAPEKKFFDSSHPKWTEALDALSKGTTKIEQIKAKFAIREDDEKFILDSMEQADGAKRTYIETLVQSSTFDEDRKMSIEAAINGELTNFQADTIIQTLKDNQLDPIREKGSVPSQKAINKELDKKV